MFSVLQVRLHQNQAVSSRTLGSLHWILSPNRSEVLPAWDRKCTLQPTLKRKKTVCECKINPKCLNVRVLTALSVFFVYIQNISVCEQMYCMYRFLFKCIYCCLFQISGDIQGTENV